MIDHKILNKAIHILNEIQTLPGNGYLMGGSLGNVVYGLVNNLPYVVNDLDIFVNVGMLSEKSNLTYYSVSNTKYKDDGYAGVYQQIDIDHFYRVVDSKIDGYINLVTYESSKEGMEFIANSFDLNCVQIGYDLSTNTFYYSKGYEDFVKNGNLKVMQLCTPGHTLLRLFDKSIKLRYNLVHIEVDLLACALSSVSIQRKSFTQKYKDLYFEHIYVLPKCIDLCVSYKRGEVTFFYLKSSLAFEYPNEITPHQLFKTFRSSELFNKVQKKMNFILCDNYIDIMACEDTILSEVNDLSEIFNKMQYKIGFINNIGSYTLSKQMAIIDKLKNKVSEKMFNKILTSSVDFDEIDLDDEFAILLLELENR